MSTSKFVPTQLKQLDDFANPLIPLSCVADHATRNGIPTAQRTVGMQVFTLSDVQYWMLNTATNTGTDADWTHLSALDTYQAPAFTSFAMTGQANPVEVGTTIASGNHTFTWGTSNSGNVAANTVSIVDTTHTVTLGSGLANNGSATLSLPSSITNNAPASQVWTIQANNSIGGSFNRTLTVNWQWKVFYGESANVTLTSGQILGLPSSALQAGFAGVYADAANNYKYLCYPDSMGSISSVTDQSTGLNVPMATASDNAAYSNTANGFSYALVSVTNGQGVTTNYRVYRTQNSLGGTLTMVVA